MGHAPPPWNFSHFVFEMGVRFGVSKLGLWVCIFLCARASKTCVLLDFDLCFSEVLDMDIRNYLSCKRSRRLDDSDSAIFVCAYTRS